MILEIKVLLQRDPLVTLSLKTLMRHKIIAHTVSIGNTVPWVSRQEAGSNLEQFWLMIPSITSIISTENKK
jgi:hypothetical protein